MSSQTITATGAGSWVCPAGSTALVITCYGGGGAGGPSDSVKGGQSGSGGGGGACSIKTVASPSGSYNYSVGTGGATSGVAGGDTWFISNDLNGCVAKGGSGGTAGGSTGGGGASGSGFGDTRYDGGDGYQGGADTVGGGGGEGAPNNANGTDATGQAGATGTAGGDGGAGGAAHSDGTAASSATGNYGGGGGGGGHTNVAGTPRAGGAGRQGWIYLTWTGPVSADTAKLGRTEATGLTWRSSTADANRIGQSEAWSELATLTAGADSAIGSSETGAVQDVTPAEDLIQKTSDDLPVAGLEDAALLTALLAGGADTSTAGVTDGGPMGPPLIGLRGAE